MLKNPCRFMPHINSFPLNGSYLYSSFLLSFCLISLRAIPLWGSRSLVFSGPKTKKYNHRKKIPTETNLIAIKKQYKRTHRVEGLLFDVSHLLCSRNVALKTFRNKRFLLSTSESYFHNLLKCIISIRMN